MATRQNRSGVGVRDSPMGSTGPVVGVCAGPSPPPPPQNPQGFRSGHHFLPWKADGGFGPHQALIHVPPTPIPESTDLLRQQLRSGK